MHVALMFLKSGVCCILFIYITNILRFVILSFKYLNQIFKLIFNIYTKTDKNDPSRFLSDGVSFRAKLIGILEVGEARGDRMCQEALQDLKVAIRAAGEHKQRITVHVAIDGLRLRDEKTGVRYIYIVIYSFHLFL